MHRGGVPQFRLSSALHGAERVMEVEDQHRTNDNCDTYKAELAQLEDKFCQNAAQLE